MRAVLDLCEELMILGKVIRSTGRSRLSNGILFLDSSLKTTPNPNDNPDPQSNPIGGKLEQAMMTPIADEGAATAVMPLIVYGEKDAIGNSKFMDLARPIDPVMAQQRQEVIGRLATGIDLPRAVLEGVADMNHWSAWMVDDDAFRHHVEPHVRRCVDMFTVGYFRSALLTDETLTPAALGGMNLEELVSRTCIWYDPTELVVHPDKSANAIQLYNLREISGKALREALGFTEEDAPSDIELVVRMVSGGRTWPLNLQLAVAARLDPTLTVPPITAAGLVPGIKGGLAIVENPSPPALPPGAPPSGASPPETPPGGPPAPAAPAVGPRPVPPPEGAARPVPGPAQSTPPGQAGARSVAFAGKAHPRFTERSARLSRQLTGIDANLRQRLQVAASATIARALEKSGARLRSKARTDKAITASIRSIPEPQIASFLGREKVAALYADAGGGPLSPDDINSLEPTFEAWVKTSQEQAVSTAAELSGASAVEVAAARQSMAVARTAAWQAFSSKLVLLADQALYDSADAITKGTLSPLDPDTLVPTGVVRIALAIAGGMNPDDAPSMDDAVIPAGLDELGTGTITSDMLSANGSEVAGYEWSHGGTDHPFEPHENLDGVEFADWTDDVLANDEGFPEVPYYFPGDHAGCSCDWTTLFTEGGDTGGDEESGGEAEEPDTIAASVEAIVDVQLTDEGAKAAGFALLAMAFGVAERPDGSLVYYWQFISQAERDQAVKDGNAMPGGEYPVRNCDELTKGVHAVGRGSGEHDAIRRHLMRQQVKHNCAADSIPSNWGSDGSLKE
jgi:hypothetical protein